MENVVLLSEIHPHASHLFNPLTQAKEWFGLLNESDLLDLQKKSHVSFLEAINLIAQRSGARGDILVLRDWAHLDYTGYPFTEPVYSPKLYDVLVENFDVLRVAITREPVAQWQSLVRLDVMQNPLRSGVFGLDQFLYGYRKYAELCVEIGFIRYEDLLRRPELSMRKLCGLLDIKFDPGFFKKWADYQTITGDIGNSRSTNKIRMPPRKAIEPTLRNGFLANADYRRACKLLGYDVLEK